MRWSLGAGGGSGWTPHTHTLHPSALTFRRASPLLQGQDGLGGDEEGQCACLEEGQPGGVENGTRGDACAPWPGDGQQGGPRQGSGST